MHVNFNRFSECNSFIGTQDLFKSRVFTYSNLHKWIKYIKSSSHGWLQHHHHKNSTKKSRINLQDSIMLVSDNSNDVQAQHDQFYMFNSVLRMHEDLIRCFERVEGAEDDQGMHQGGGGNNAANSVNGVMNTTPLNNSRSNTEHIPGRNGDNYRGGSDMYPQDIAQQQHLLQPPRRPVISYNDIFMKDVTLGDIGYGYNVVSDQITNLQLIDDKCERINILSNFLGDIKNEIILSVCGDIYHTVFSDVVKTIATFGLYYFYYKQKKKYRSVYILTNKRIVAIEYKNKLGIIPSDLLKVAIVVRSLFPRNITNGSLHKSSNAGFWQVCLSNVLKHFILPLPRFITTIVSDNGVITFNLPEKAVHFSKSLQMSVKRRDSVLISPQVATPLYCFDTLKPSEIDIMPLLPFEQFYMKLDLPSSYAAINEYCGYRDIWAAQSYFKFFFSCCFPLCPLLTSCGIRPFQDKTTLFITNHTLYYVIRREHFPFFSCATNENSVFVGKLCSLYEL